MILIQCLHNFIFGTNRAVGSPIWAYSTVVPNHVSFCWVKPVHWRDESSDQRKKDSVQKLFLLPIISVTYLGPDKPLNLSVFKWRTCELQLNLSGGSFDLRCLWAPRPACGHHQEVYSMLFSLCLFPADGILQIQSGTFKDMCSINFALTDDWSKYMPSHLPLGNLLII